MGDIFSKGSHVAKISADGKTLVKEVFVKEAYGICEAGDYVFVATFNGKKSSVYALDKSDLSTVGELKYAEQFCDLSDVAYGGGVLYVGDHGDNGAVAGRVLTAKLDLTSAEEIIEPGTDKGDMNGDKAIDNKDVVILFRYVSGSDKAEDETVYDFNGDKNVDNKDVVALFRFVSSK